MNTWPSSSFAAIDFDISNSLLDLCFILFSASFIARLSFSNPSCITRICCSRATSLFLAWESRPMFTIDPATCSTSPVIRSSSNVVNTPSSDFLFNNWRTPIASFLFSGESMGMHSTAFVWYPVTLSVSGLKYCDWYASSQLITDALLKHCPTSPCVNKMRISSVPSPTRDHSFLSLLSYKNRVPRSASTMSLA